MNLHNVPSFKSVGSLSLMISFKIKQTKTIISVLSAIYEQFIWNSQNILVEVFENSWESECSVFPER